MVSEPPPCELGRNHSGRVSISEKKIKLFKSLVTKGWSYPHRIFWKTVFGSWFYVTQRVIPGCCQRHEAKRVNNGRFSRIIPPDNQSKGRQWQLVIFKTPKVREPQFCQHVATLETGGLPAPSIADWCPGVRLACLCVHLRKA